MRYNQLQLSDKKLFDAYLCLNESRLAAHAFEAIFMWRSLYNIFWVEMKKNLCVFFKDAVGCFLFLPPLGKMEKEYAVKESFAIMKSFNSNTLISRVENIPEKESEWYEALGYEVKEVSRDYICRRNDIADFRGNAFKKKRASAHFFESHYDYEYRPYQKNDKDDCCLLFESWVKERKEKYADRVYQQLLDDNYGAFKTMLDCYESLQVCGYVIRLKGMLKAVTIGYPLGSNCFVVAFEICDLSIRGIAPFIFREFCRTLNGYADINMMDDCGLDNLKKIKNSYRPYRKEKSYSARCYE